MNIIYKSFLRRKITKTYGIIFILLSLILAFLLISNNYLINKANKAYLNSYLYFTSQDNINLEKEKNITTYNKALKVECNKVLTDVFITENKPIINNNYQYYKECHIDNYTIEYSIEPPINIIQNTDLYQYLKQDQDEYYYFISLKEWLKKDQVIKKLTDKYHIEIIAKEERIDDMDYKNIIFIFDIFIKIIKLLFVILFIISLFNTIIDEKKNNALYYCLGYSTTKIVSITFNKILILLIIPIIILVSTIFILK